MERLARLINCLRPAEAQLIKAFYQARFLGKPNRRLELLNLLLEGKVNDNEAASRIIYHHKSDSTLSQLKKRVREDILNFFLLLPPHKLYSSALNRVEHTCRKCLIQGKILLSRGLQQEGVALLHKAGKLAEKYEIPEITLAVYDTLRTNATLKTKAKTLHQYHSNINKALMIYRDLLKAKEIAWDTRDAMQIPGKGTTSSDGLGSIRVNKIAFWFKLAALKYRLQHMEFDDALQLAQELLKMVADQPFLCSSVTRVGLHMEICKIHMYLGQWDRALGQVEKACELCNTQAAVHCYSLEMLFLVHFHRSEFLQAENILKQLNSHYQIKAGRIQFHWPLYRGSLEFKKGQYKASLKVLNSLGGKGNRNAWLQGKLLELLNIIELGDLDWLEYKLEAFRKATYQSSPRYQLICRILLTLVRCNLDYSRTLARLGNEFQQFEQDASMQWDPTGLELVNFQQWFQDKTKTMEEPANVKYQELLDK